MKLTKANVCRGVMMDLNNLVAILSMLWASLALYAFIRYFALVLVLEFSEVLLRYLSAPVAILVLAVSLFLIVFGGFLMFYFMITGVIGV